MKYEVVQRWVQRWVTGERAEKDKDVIKVELEDLMREYMELSGQKVFWPQNSDRQRIMEARVLAYRQTRHHI